MRYSTQKTNFAACIYLFTTLLMKLFFNLFLISSILVLLSCQEQVAARVQKKVIMPTSISKNTTMVFSDSGRVRMRIFAPTRIAYTGDNAYTDMPDGLTAEIYTASGQVTYLKADKATQKASDGTIIFRKNVKILNPKKEELTTELLRWNEKTHFITTGAAVQIKTPDKLLYGDSLQANENFSKYKIVHPKGIIQAKKF